MRRWRSGRRVPCAGVRGFVALALVILAGACSGPAPTHGGAAWDFDHAAVGAVPPGWRIAQTNPTQAMATWQVVDDAASGSRALALTESRNHDGTFNLAIAEGERHGDLDLSVRVKGIRGEEDRGGGPIWRCRDENDYYVCRLNPLEGNFRVYVVRGGKRRQLDSASVELESGRWYEVRVVMRGSRITCSLDGVEMLHAVDDTFPEAGLVGLWTKADAETAFDDLVVRGLAGE